MKSKKRSQANLSVILKLILDIVEVQSKKIKALGVLTGSFLSSPVGRGNSLYNFFKRGNLKKNV